MICPNCHETLEEGPINFYNCNHCCVSGTIQTISEINEILEKFDPLLQQAKDMVNMLEERRRFILSLIAERNLVYAKIILSNTVNLKICPNCYSMKVYVYEKEEYNSWIYDIKVIKHEKSQKMKYEEYKCLECGYIYHMIKA